VFVPRINLLTRFELFLREKDLAPAMVAEEAVYARQYLLRVRLGKDSPTRRFIAAVTAACGRLLDEQSSSDAYPLLIDGTPHFA
jgi:hypothetical protein